MADGAFIGNTAQALKDLDTGTAMPMNALVRISIGCWWRAAIGTTASCACTLIRPSGTRHAA